LKSKTDSYPQAAKSVIAGNPFASVSREEVMDNPPSKRIDQTTGKTTKLHIDRKIIPQAQISLDKGGNGRP
jgi:hypothetical protein